MYLGDTVFSTDQRSCVTEAELLSECLYTVFFTLKKNTFFFLLYFKITENDGKCEKRSTVLTWLLLQSAEALVWLFPIITWIVTQCLASSSFDINSKLH